MSSPHWSLLLVLPVLTTAGAVSDTRAEWARNGNPLAVTPSLSHAAVADGAGGVIAVWADERLGPLNSDIYAQRFDGSGNPLWPANGVPVCVATGSQLDPKIVSDGASGAIIAWSDIRGIDADVYAQRIDASGTALWLADGRPVCAAPQGQSQVVMCDTPTGGAIVAWVDSRNLNDDIFALDLSSMGVNSWAANGFPVCQLAGTQNGVAITSDMAGGAIFVWMDSRNDPSGDIYGDRFNEYGSNMWAVNGISICSENQFQWNPKVISDGAGGAVVTWADLRDGVDFDVYAQRMSSPGAALWGSNGLLVSGAPADQTYPRLAPDGTGGAVIAWSDSRNGPSDVYVQRVDGSGYARWTGWGTAIASVASARQNPDIVSDGASGAIVAWADDRNGNGDIYAQRLDYSGSALWESGGMVVCDAPFFQDGSKLVSDGANGAVVAWSDLRPYSATNAYAQRIEGRYGYWGRPEPAVVSAQDNPSDQGGKIVLRWLSSERDRYFNPTINYYSVWRSTDAALAPLAGGPAVNVVPDPVSIDRDFSGVAIWLEDTPSGPEYWEWAANVGATYQATYSLSVPTRQDSTAADPATHYFKVIAHESAAQQTHMWESDVAAAWSVDNLAPAAPLSLTAQRVGPDVHLHWNRVRVADLRDYAVYRESSNGVTPAPIYFLDSAVDTVLVDASAPSSALYYIVTARDIHDNESPPSNEAGVSPVTGVANTPPLTALSVLPHHPNPFSTSARVTIGLPGAVDVDVEVYDVAGRRVAARSLGVISRGWTSVVLDAMDDGGRLLPSGVYFYRVTAAGETITRKMVIAR